MDFCTLRHQVVGHWGNSKTQPQQVPIPCIYQTSSVQLSILRRQLISLLDQRTVCLFTIFTTASSCLVSYHTPGSVQQLYCFSMSQQMPSYGQSSLQPSSGQRHTRLSDAEIHCMANLSFMCHAKPADVDIYYNGYLLIQCNRQPQDSDIY